jgi:hypothetical protein
MLALGGFVGALLTLGIAHIDNYSSFKKVVMTILGAAFSGVVMKFAEKLGGSSSGGAFFMYPVGLLLSLFWLYAAVLVKLAIAPKTRLFGVSGIVGLVLSTVAAVAFTFPPALKEVFK